MYERFDDSARGALQNAHRAAMKRNHEYVGTEHLLLGLLEDQESVAIQAMVNRGVTPDDIRRELNRILGDNEET
ncbi:Clp protease N-terminal domain-containing protein [Aeoliella sp.]|uniref:Clp protease N-terminal domain-containing protein n=1 Tax=Aeoliella sp. TaxID=2795800 RepID=UPI003CCBE7AF